MADLVPLDKPPAVLADRAQQILAEFGYTEPPTDSAHGFELGTDYARWIIDTEAVPLSTTILAAWSRRSSLSGSKSPRLSAV